MPGKTLSICIPTFNFGNFIGETLDSIIRQMRPGVEIVILDGGSTDMTAEVVSNAQKTGADIRYHRLDQRGGIDRDMARVVELATGRYCWLFSGDDVMRSGAIDRMLALVESGRDVYLCKHSMCTLDMKVLGDRDVIKSARPLIFNLKDQGDRERYFELAQTTEAFFSFIGGIVVRTEKWRSAKLNEEFVGSCWAHVVRLFELMDHVLSVEYVPEVLLDRRGDNDSFANQGVVNRYRIAIEGYNRIADGIVGHESRYGYHVRRVLRNEFGLRMFLHAKLSCLQSPGVEDSRLLNRLIKKTYCDTPIRGMLISGICNTMPLRFYASLRGAYRRMRAACN